MRCLNIFSKPKRLEVNWQRLVAQLGERYEIENIYFKPYPCCRHYHAVIDGIVALREQHQVKARDVVRIDVGLYAVGVSGYDHKHADNLLDAHMNAPVAAALAVVDGELAAHHFLPESLLRPEVQRLIPAVDTHLDAECERIYPGIRSGAVRVELEGGRSLEKRVIEPTGETKNPMSDADLERKFTVNCEKVVGKAKCERLLEMVWGFDKNPDVAELISW